MNVLVAIHTALEAQTCLASLCSLATRLFPDEDWSTVEPKLERGWRCSDVRGRYGWDDVRDYAHARWESRAAP